MAKPVSAAPKSNSRRVDRSWSYAALSRIFLAAGLPFLFLPVTTASYNGVPPDKVNQASAPINVARNIGGSMGVALAQTILAQRQQFHQIDLSAVKEY